MVWSTTWWMAKFYKAMTLPQAFKDAAECVSSFEIYPKRADIPSYRLFPWWRMKGFQIRGEMVGGWNSRWLSHLGNPLGLCWECMWSCLGEKQMQCKAKSRLETWSSSKTQSKSSFSSSIICTATILSFMVLCLWDKRLSSESYKHYSCLCHLLPHIKRSAVYSHRCFHLFWLIGLQNLLPINFGEDRHEFSSISRWFTSCSPRTESNLTDLWSSETLWLFVSFFVKLRHEIKHTA